ncbi:hypothetical protein T01_206, partial [Trichinella spiralis]
LKLKSNLVLECTTFHIHINQYGTGRFYMKCNHFEFYISSSDRSLFLHICRTTIYFVVDASTVHRIKYPNNPVVILSITE